MGTLAANLISFWELEEASGTRVDAVTASANDLTDNNTVTQVAGIVGNAARFTNPDAGPNNEWLSHAHNASLSCGNIDFTLVAWAKLATKAAGSNSVAGKNGPIGEYQLFQEGVTDRWRWDIYNATIATHTIRADTYGATSTTVWAFLVGQLTSATNTAEFYVDNVSQGTVVGSGTPATDAASDFGIGGLSPTPTNLLDGMVDQVGLWKRVLTPTELTFLYNGGAGRTYAEILAEGGPSAGTDTATAGLTESLNTVSVTLRIQESG